MEAVVSSRVVRMWWTRSLVQRLLAWTAPSGVPKEVMTVLSQNSSSVVVAADIMWTVRRTRFPLLLLRARQKRNSVPVRVAFEVVRMNAMRAASVVGSVRSGN